MGPVEEERDQGKGKRKRETKSGRYNQRKEVKLCSKALIDLVGPFLSA